MERYDVSEPQRFTQMVNAAEAGVPAEITRGGAVVARVVPEPRTAPTGGQQFLRRLAELHRKMPPELMGGDATAEIRTMRDEEW